MPLTPSAMQDFDGCHLAFVVAVDLAGIGLEVNAEFSGLGGGTFLHLDEKGVGVGLGNEAGANSGGSRCQGGKSEQGCCCYGRFQYGFHDDPPMEHALIGLSIRLVAFAIGIRCPVADTGSFIELSEFWAKSQ